MDQLLRLTREAERSHFWFRGFRWFIRPHIARAAGDRRNLWLLDAGCGTGDNLALLAPWGNAVGFDLSWSGLQLARRDGQLPVAQANVTAIPFPDSTFDIVGSFDVLQCIYAGSDAVAVREMTRVLKPGGTLILNVAAFESLRGRHAALSQEVCRYTPDGVRRLLEAAGLQPTTLTCTFAVTVPLLWVRRKLERRAGGGVAPAGEGDIVVPPEPLNALLTALLWIERWVLRVVSLPVGSSILCVARKPPTEVGRQK